MLRVPTHKGVVVRLQILNTDRMLRVPTHGGVVVCLQIQTEC